MADKFSGFQSPEENWSKLPHQLIEALPDFTSQGELMVVLYILRHTWGYQEYDQPKKITLDEFMRGRKTKKGKRIDGGVGMSKGAIVRGLQRAEEHGFIVSEKDEKDKARIKKYYMLKMIDEDVLDVVSQNETPKASDIPKQDPDVPKEDTGVTKQDSYGPEIGHRSEKETLERNNRKEKDGKKTADPLSFHLERETVENNQANYAVPVPAGGDDCVADAALSALYSARRKLPPIMGTKEWDRQRFKVSEALRAYGYEKASLRLVEKAAELLCKRKGDWTNVFYPSFAMDFGQALSDAEDALAAEEQRRARDQELTEASMAALDARRAARRPPPADDEVGAIVKSVLEEQIGQNEFRRYVEPTGFTCDDGVLHVAASDEEARDWLEDHLGLIIKRVLAGAAGGPDEVAFEVDDD